ncbi:MAG: hypothetical protein ACRBEE_11760 [Arenicella sp.]
MKKAILTLITLPFLFSCSFAKDKNEKAVLVGSYLISSHGEFRKGENAGHPDIVRIGDGLIEKLKELGPKNDICRSDLLLGLEDIEASHIIKISCGSNTVLAIRLKYSDRLSRFHILGWWTSGL